MAIQAPAFREEIGSDTFNPGSRILFKQKGGHPKYVPAAIDKSINDTDRT